MTERQRVVISDVHGEADALRRVVDTYGRDTHYIFAGDFVDRGPDTKGVMDIMKELPHMTATLGNHEYVALAALTDARRDIRDMHWGYSWLNPDPSARIEDRFIESYGHDPIPTYGIESKVRFKNLLGQLGHLALLESAMSYYEDDQLVVVHAGPMEHIAWSHTKLHLDSVDNLRETHIFGDRIPRALNSHEDSLSPYRPYDITNKYLVTGHAHIRREAEERITHYNGGGRVLLASPLTAGDPLFVFDVEDKKVRAF